ncbi:aminotransferase class I/II-fold pyridoxal phosphate-dependent enzyme [Streptomyces malaysiensis]|uniref:aminotransferase class I/II-fold pyridoxal phosphate-dependent enzyme n=1 Tax=Streptomyces malaysiensis TaxID=92644 RepID=UPI000BFF31B2|nr:aminotransferase class I/II-fold pyridoxal phosphate-dependent enzyme [Streptomyces malaysiensis]ATL88677.1 aminotransferase, classes I and II [Streptomyces malaysiensis]
MRLPDFLLEDWIDRYRSYCRYNIAGSDVEGLALDELLSLRDGETRALWDSLTLGYSHPLGHPLLRAEIARLHPGVGPESVHVFAGTTEAVLAAVSAALSPGDHAVVVGPAYQLLTGLPAVVGAEVDQVDLTSEDGWALDVDRVGSVCRPGTRLLILNAPNNPTGALPSPEQVRALAGLAESLGARLLVDEVYRGLEEPETAPPSGVELGPHAVTVSGVSKAYGLAGLRIGWVVSTDADYRRRLREFRYWTTLNNSAPSEVLAVVALRARATLLGRARGIVTANRTLLEDFLAQHSDWFDWAPTRAGTTAYPRLLQDDARRAAETLATRHGVFVIPSSVIPSAGEHLRIGLGRTDLPEGLDALADALASLRPGELSAKAAA